jgi:hypothetical protein
LIQLIIEILKPCKCDEKGISCGSNEWFNLKHIFDRDAKSPALRPCP